jgi:uncharacterized membrane protein
MKDFIVYFGIVIFAVLFLFFGNMIASTDLEVLDPHDDNVLIADARVTRVVDVIENVDSWFSETTVIFEAQLARGDGRGEIVTARHSLGGHFTDAGIKVEPGDNVVLMALEYEDEWHFIDFVRVNNMVYLIGAFILLLLFFGRTKGLSAILSLGFTCVAIFAVFIPSILSGRNIYISTIIISAFVIIVTLFLLNGINKKSIAAITGCFGGVLSAGLLTLIMSNVLVITGIVNSESRHLQLLPTDTPIDLRAIVFAGIIIGAVGAVMDVAVSISSALWELKEKAPELTFKSIFDSGINIGRDIMGSMTNTLVLAYIGSSLSIILILIVFVGSLTELLNMELVTVEVLQAVIGSMGILLTMPLTALVCAFLFAGKPRRKVVKRGIDRYYENYIEREIQKDKV